MAIVANIKRAVCYALFRVLLPVILLAAVVLRYNALSFLYAICLLLAPLVSAPTVASIRGGTGHYLKAVIIVSLLGTLTQIIFQIVWASDPDEYELLFANCTEDEKIARQIAVERLDNVPVLHVIRLGVPDAIIFVTSLVVYILSLKLLPIPSPEDVPDLNELPITTGKRRRSRVDTFVEFAGELLVMILLVACGVIVPAVFGAVYFIIFLLCATLWAFYKGLGNKFNYLKIFLLLYSGSHFLLLYLYQFQFFQEAIPPNVFTARLLGLTAIIKTDCMKTWELYIDDNLLWPYFVNPGLILFLYWVLAFEIRHWLHRGRTSDSVSEISEDSPSKKKWRQKDKNTERQVLADAEAGEEDEGLVEGEQPAGYSSVDLVTSADGSTKPVAATADPERTDDLSQGSKKKWDKRPAYQTVMVYVMRQSYIAALIAMMAWSIAYHSWLALALLLGACIIWILPHSRKACLILSPLLLLYVELLLIGQYIYGMNLSELPEVVDGVNISEIGFKKFTYPCLNLALQVFFALWIFLTVRQFMREKKTPTDPSKDGVPLNDVENGSFKGGKTFTEFMSNNLWYVFCKYWIFVCAGMMLAIAITDTVAYRLIYLILFLLFALSFQLCFSFWRVTMYLYWWVVILYSMFVLVVLYTYQFSNFPEYWKDGTGMSNQTLIDLGLEQFDTGVLVGKLLTPTSFLIIIILQVHYFHKPFLQLCALDRYKKDPITPTAVESTEVQTDTTEPETDTESPKKSHAVKDTLKTDFLKAWTFGSKWWPIICSYLWRLSEIHVFKLVALVVIVVAVNEISAISAVYVILVAIFLPLTGIHIVLSHILQIYTAVVIFVKVVFQWETVELKYFETDCSNTSAHDPPLNQTAQNNIWIGFAKSSNIEYYLRNYIAILLVIGFESIVRYHQIQHFNNPNIVKPRQGIIYPDIKRPDADRGLRSCLKFFDNYFFYKFGLEICYIMSAATIAIRVDAYSVVYAILLGVSLLMSRRGNSRFFPIYTLILVILLPLQYLSVVGFPLAMCIEYPWDHYETVDRNLEQWLFMPDYLYPPRAQKLIADFIQLLFICLQWRVFRIEFGSEVEEHGGGDNTDVVAEVEAETPIPVPDFTTSSKNDGTGLKRTYLDVVKYAVFEFMFWVTLAIIFITGTNSINIFSMGYVIAVFAYLWQGQDFLLKPLRKLLRSWNCIIGYTFLVLFIKACLQLVGCVYINKLWDDHCWFIQLFGITCLHPSNEYVAGTGVDDCPVERDNSGLVWDVVCFAFLLLQKRIYSCHYFRHVVSEIIAQSRLASRGAELINRITIREVVTQKEKEQIMLDGIKTKMAKLQAKQAALKKDYQEPEDHFTAIRSGDYYLFEDVSEDEDSDASDQADILTYGISPHELKEQEKEKMGPMQLANVAYEEGADEAVEKAEDEEDGEKPSTSDEDKPEEEEKVSVWQKIKNIFMLVVHFLTKIAEWLIFKFNSLSRNYRLVNMKLTEELVEVKEDMKKEKQHQLEMHPIDEDATDGDAQAPDDLVEITVSTGDSPKKSSRLSGSKDSIDELIERDESEDQTKFEKEQPVCYRLLVATYNLLISHSELICYFLMILNMMMSASILALAYPLMVFLWGMLSVPRPSKTFWITVITYTEAVVVAKYLFQFQFFPWNDGTIHEDPFFVPRILGIERKDGFASIDLALLLVLFIHRTILKRNGLWKDAEAMEKDMDKAENKELSPPSSPTQLEADNKPSLETGDAAELSKDTEKLLPESEIDSKTGKEKKFDFSMFSKPFKDFYHQLRGETFQATTDVYAPMFLCDFINFFILVFCFWAFGSAASGGGGDVTTYLSDNKIPIPFIVMLITQFLLIIIDRALFLRKFVLGKLIFQIILVFVIHIWIFFVLPAATLSPDGTRWQITDNKPALLFYFIKCIYFALSCYQIRSGYPTRILGNFLTKRYDYLNMFLFKGFMAIPFILELRSLMDWIWTDTTLAIGSWLQMEDIYANVFLLKCARRAEHDYPTPRGQKRKAVIKYGVGGLLLFIIILIIWFPLVIFAMANAVFVANPPISAKLDLSVAGYQPLVSIQAQEENIAQATAAEVNLLLDYYGKNRNAVGFISGFEYEDITKITLSGKSTSIWGISPPAADDLVNSLLNSSSDIRVEVSVSFSREPSGGGVADELTNEFLLLLGRYSKEQYKIRQGLADIITGVSSDGVNVTRLFPRFLRLGSKGRAAPIKILNNAIGYSNISLNLDKNNDSTLDGTLDWWSAEEILLGGLFNPDLNTKNPTKSPDITFITFNDRVAPSTFSFITGYGIIGLYISFILLIGRILRLSTTGLYANIMFKELPCVDNLLRLCLNIYLVREMKEFCLEEDLYAKLLFVYRSTQTMVKWTRKPPPKEKAD